MNQSIITAVIEQFGDEEYFRDCAADIAQYGADGGFNGFIYYSDTVEFANKHRAKLLGMLKEYAKEFGREGPFSLMATFGYCEGLSPDEIAEAFFDAENDNHTQVMNCLAWFALEEVARYVSENEEEEA